MQFPELFKNRNYCFFLTGEVTYRIGIWIAYVTISLLVVKYKGNAPLYLGLIGVAYHLPMALFSLIGGVLADRVDRLRILRISQFVFLLPSTLLLIAIFTHHQNYWLAFISAFLYGTAMALNNPALYAAVKDIVTDAKHVTQAVSLSTIAVRITQFLANGLGGLLFAYITGVGCLIIDFCSHLLSLFFFTRIKHVKSQLSLERRHPWHDFIMGLNYVKENFALLAINILMIFSGTIGWAYIFQLPAINQFILHGDAKTLGLMLMVGGVGGTLGGLYLTFRSSVMGSSANIKLALLLLIIGMLLLAWSHNSILSNAAVFIIDFALSILFICGNILLQQLSSANLPPI